MYPILSSIHSPADIKRLSREELALLAEEIRQRLIQHCMVHSAHFASNMGVVELTIALQYVFDLPPDQVIFDVGHQIYPFKMLTGRLEQFHTIRSAGGLSGYPHPRESEHDLFHTGHASTAISLGLGVATARKQKGEDGVTIMVVGDGSLSGGIAYEGLNNAGSFDGPFIVILNDNEQSISPSVGSLSRHLSILRESKLYNRIRYGVRDALDKIPLIGRPLRALASSLLDSIHRLTTPGEIFTQLGFRYFGPVDGHDLPSLISHLQRLKNVQHPVFLHVYTQKGHGFKPAEENPARFHSPRPTEMVNLVQNMNPASKSQPSVPKPGNDEKQPSTEPSSPQKDEGSEKSQPRSWSAVMGKCLIDLAHEDERVCAITAAMADGTGISQFQKEFPDRFFDVGIAEQHGVAFSAGLARAGRRPFCMIYSTFLQRAYDMLFHEVSLQENLPVVFGIDRAGVVGDDGPTHHGVFDIAYLRHLPNLILMAPKDAAEGCAMMRFALQQPISCAIRYPRESVPEFDEEFPVRPIEKGKGEILREGKTVAILAYGALVARALQAADILREQDIHATVANARFAKPIDAELVEKLVRNHEIVLTVEDHQRAGGFGSAVLETLNHRRADTRNLFIAAIGDFYVEHATREQQLSDLQLDGPGIADRVRTILSEYRAMEAGIESESSS